MLSKIPRSKDRRWLFWIVFLALGQALDVLTTRVDLGQGALEGNAIAANLMSMDGFRGLLFIKLALVAAMAATVLLVLRYADDHPGRRASLAQLVVWRGLQLCVVVLLMTGLHNVLVLASMQGWSTPTILTTLPLTLT